MQFHNPTADVFVPDGLPPQAALARTTHMAIAAHQDDIEIMAAAPILECFQQRDLWFTGVVLTALYMTRQMILVFFGNSRDHASAHAHESPAVMTLPLVVLAVCAIVFSLVLTPAWPWLHDYLTGEAAEFDPIRVIQPLLFLSLSLVASGFGMGLLLYRSDGVVDLLEKSQPALFRFLEKKMWLDELYEQTVLCWSASAARLADWMDRNVWDGLVRAVGVIGGLFSRFSANFDEGGINTGVDQGCDRAQALGRTMSGWHAGQIQSYLRGVGLGMLALIILYAWLT